MESRYEPTLQNATFRGDDDRSEMNACVGRNGQPGYREYANGFCVAASILIEKVIAEKDREFLRYNLDELIYPIVFTMRHAIELRLKDTVYYLQELSRITGRRISLEDQVGEHDIAIIFERVRQEAENLDNRYISIMDEISELIHDVATVDPTGQTFRYPYDITGNNKHLEQVSLINIYVLQERFSQIDTLLETLYQLNQALIGEYAQKSFTSKLSRLQIFELATMLPPHSQWVDESFDAVRQRCREHFDISKHELSTAITLVRNNYELAHLIGLKLPLKAASETDLITFFDSWIKLHPHPLMAESRVIGSAEIYDGMIEHLRLSGEAIMHVAEELTPQAIADIMALFKLARLPTYSEDYVRLYEVDQENLVRLAAGEASSFQEEVRYIVTKKNALLNIMKSLYRLNQHDLAELLERRYYKFIECLDLSSARDGTLFNLPNVLRYPKTGA